MNHYYIILKNGEAMSFKPRPILNAIYLIQQLESHINRLKEHSPYTIKKISFKPRPILRAGHNTENL